MFHNIISYTHALPYIVYGRFRAINFERQYLDHSTKLKAMQELILGNVLISVMLLL